MIVYAYGFVVWTFWIVKNFDVSGIHSCHRACRCSYRHLAEAIAISQFARFSLDRRDPWTVLLHWGHISLVVAALEAAEVQHSMRSKLIKLFIVTWPHKHEIHGKITFPTLESMDDFLLFNSLKTLVNVECGDPERSPFKKQNKMNNLCMRYTGV